MVSLDDCVCVCVRACVRACVCVCACALNVQAKSIFADIHTLCLLGKCPLTDC